MSKAREEDRRFGASRAAVRSAARPVKVAPERRELADAAAYAGASGAENTKRAYE